MQASKQAVRARGRTTARFGADPTKDSNFVAGIMWGVLSKQVLSEVALISDPLRSSLLACDAVNKTRYICPLGAGANVQASVSTRARICLLIESDAGE